MKKTTEIKFNKKTYELCYTIKSLAMMERLINKSITYIFSSGVQNLVRQANIDFTVAGLVAGLNLNSQDEAYDFVDSYCQAGGNLDELNGKIIEAVVATGLFTQGMAPNNQESVPKKQK